MKKLLIFSLFLLSCAIPALAQNSFYSDHAMRYNVGFPAYPASGAVITVCQFTGVGLPCTPLAPICNGPTDLTCAAPNPFNADANGNFGFWAPLGLYIVTITGANLNGYTLIVSQDLPINGVATNALNATNLAGPGAVTGTYTHSGVETFNGTLIVNSGGALTGTFTGNPIFSGNPSFTGTPVFGVLGNEALKYASASAYRYVDASGNDTNDGLSPGTAFATPQKCNTVVLSLGGGICDARTLYNYTFNTEIDVGQHSPAIPVTLLLPHFGNWTCNVTGGTSNCFRVFQFGYAISTAAGQGTQFVLTASATANVVDVCDTEPSPVAGGSYIHWAGMGCASASGATVSGAVINIQALFDNSWISDIQGGASSTSTKSLYIHGVCCSAHVQRVKGNGNLTSTNVPCTLGPQNNGADIGPISCTGGGTGANQVAIVQNSVGGAAAHYHDIYTEADSSSDNTTVMGVTGVSGLADVVDHLTLGADAEPGSTRYMIDIANGSSLIAHNIELGGTSGNGINDHNPGRGTIVPGTSAIITDYSVQGCCGLDGYFTKPGFFGLTNNTGLQLFNTATTCTTAASAGATCTTAAITLPVAESDTAYRAVCVGKGITNVPVVIATTNSSATQFTITIAALTAAAATFSSYDCTVGHN